jgi:hypothetical protein
MMFRRGAVIVALLSVCLVIRPSRLAGQDGTRGVGVGSGIDTAGLAASKFHAILIAVQDYSDPAVGKLKWPMSDADRLRRVLIDRYRFDDRNVESLKNPKRGEILNTLDSLADALGPNDNLLIFYAGHGKWEEAAKQGYWLPVEAKRAERAEWISSEDVNDRLRRMKARHVLLMADACFAGASLTREVGDDKAMEMLYQLPSRQAMTSGANEPVPDKSVFLDYVVKRLTENSDLYLPADRLFDQIRIGVINNSDAQPLFRPIHNVNDQGGQFLFALRRPGTSGPVADEDTGTTGTKPDSGGKRSTGPDSGASIASATPRGAVEANNRRVVESINRKDVDALGSLYVPMQGTPPDWKQRLMDFVRQDLVSAKLETQQVQFEGADGSTAGSDVVISVRYRDPVAGRGVKQTRLHIWVNHQRFGADWIPRSFSLVEKPPY